MNLNWQVITPTLKVKIRNGMITHEAHSLCGCVRKHTIYECSLVADTIFNIKKEHSEIKFKIPVKLK